MKISFIGTERGDIPYFLHKVALKNKKSVLFIDNSVKKELSDAVIPRNERSRLRKKAIFIKNIIPTEEYMSNFDIVIEFAGKRGYCIDADYTYLLSSFFPYELDDNKKLLDLSSKNLSGVIMLDKLSNKISLSEARKRLGLPRKSDMDVYVLDEDTADKSKLFNLYVNGRAGKATAQIDSLTKDIAKKTRILEEKKKVKEEDTWL